MRPFALQSPFVPTGDQPQAITKLVAGVKAGKKHQTLLGVTGSGKTFTMANVVAQIQQPTLIIAHNKTLAGQLYQEFRDFFPNNAVSYFVSYYDYYQPEAYIPSTDTYIEKESTINDDIDKLRLSATTNLLTRPDTLVVASVSAIYNLGSPAEYGNNILRVVEGEVISRETLLLKLSDLQYERSEAELKRGSYRLRGDLIQVWPAYENYALELDTLENRIQSIIWIDPISASKVNYISGQQNTNSQDKQREFIIYPAKHFMMDPKSQAEGIAEIQRDLDQQLANFNEQGKVLEAFRLKQKVNYDLDMMREFGFVNGIENYTRYFDGRQPGEPPYTLVDYFKLAAQKFSDGKFLTIIDESHMTLPQIRGMHHGDRSRKQTLIDFGFRLPSALDNRPLTFEEFMTTTDKMVYVSATPNELEVSLSGGETVEQLIRPTGLTDPVIELRPTRNQIEDLVIEIMRRQALSQRTLVTTLTKKMSEALTEYLNDHSKIDQLLKSHQARPEEDNPDQIISSTQSVNVEHMSIGKLPSEIYQHSAKWPAGKETIYPKVAYLHSDVDTLDRSDILDDLRRGVYDVLVGINLLREGLDLPEVTLVAILDADKEGFLRSATALVQTMGRAARHLEGRVILYADNLTKSMQFAINETNRRRQIQSEYNIKHNITPLTISKPIREKMVERAAKEDSEQKSDERGIIINLNKRERVDLSLIKPADMTPKDKIQMAAKLRRRMREAANAMDFELAALLRDTINNLEDSNQPQ